MAVNHIEMAVEGFKKFDAAITTMARAIGQFAIAIASPPGKQFAYLIYHERLPGSLRTSRLRKKRKTRVENWYRKQVKNKRSAMRTDTLENNNGSQ